MTVYKVFTVGDNEDWEFSVRWLDTEGVPFDLNGVYCQVRKKPGQNEGNDPVLDLSVGSGIDMEAEGWINILVPADTLSEIESGGYVFDLILHRSDGRRYRAIDGVLNINLGVTAVA